MVDKSSFGLLRAEQALNFIPLLPLLVVVHLAYLMVTVIEREQQGDVWCLKAYLAASRALVAKPPSILLGFKNSDTANCAGFQLAIIVKPFAEAIGAVALMERAVVGIDDNYFFFDLEFFDIQ